MPALPALEAGETPTGIRRPAHPMQRYVLGLGEQARRRGGAMAGHFIKQAGQLLRKALADPGLPI